MLQFILELLITSVRFLKALGDETRRKNTEVTERKNFGTVIVENSRIVTFSIRKLDCKCHFSLKRFWKRSDEIIIRIIDKLGALYI